VDRAGGANMQWLKSISSSSFKEDVLIVAGRLACTHMHPQGCTCM
jgi:hypothetical protein